MSGGDLTRTMANFNLEPAFDLNAIPGYQSTPAPGKGQKAVFVDVEKLEAEIARMAEAFPGYDFSDEVAKERERARMTIEGRKSIIKRRHAEELYKLQVEEAVLNETELPDSNIKALRMQIALTRKHLDSVALKQDNKYKRDLARWERHKAMSEMSEPPKPPKRSKADAEAAVQPEGNEQVEEEASVAQSEEY